LTFFFRQMPQLIENGYLYIAQPPLYKVTRGKSQQYLKDERALEDYLIENGIEGAILRLESGEERSGLDLKKLLDEARLVRTVLGGLHSRYDKGVVEQAAIVGLLKPVGDAASAEKSVADLAARLDAIAQETERGWTGRIEKNGIILERTLRGVKQVATLDSALLASADALKLADHAKSLAEAYGRPSALSRKGDDTIVNGPTALFDAVTAVGRKGLTMQRYKGLGEMNPEQLWETTLDRNVRSLLQVKVREAVDADDIFTKLMGDVVEPRREFIQTNALSVANLDV